MIRGLIAAVLVAASAPAAAREPVIDMHLHANAPDSQGPPPLAMCTPFDQWPVRDTSTSWLDIFMPVFKQPACKDPVWSPATDAEMQRRTFAELEKHNVFALLSGDSERTDIWKRALPQRILAVDPSGDNVLAQLPQLKTALAAARTKGELTVIGEIGVQYAGYAPNDPRLEPLWQAAVQHDTPVGIHVGPGPPGTAYLPGLGKYRMAHSSPLLFEDALVRHPKLRIYLMHAGYPMLDDTLALLYAHPQVHLDIGVIVYTLPRAEFYRYLRTIVEAGFGNRVMFGSDQMIWPETIGRSIAVIEDAPFLSKRQKRDILYNNAARFLRLDDATIKRHHAM